jgi:hypothetical protein
MVTRSPITGGDREEEALVLICCWFYRQGFSIWILAGLDCVGAPFYLLTNLHLFLTT